MNTLHEVRLKEVLATPKVLVNFEDDILKKLEHLWRVTDPGRKLSFSEWFNDFLKEDPRIRRIVVSQSSDSSDLPPEDPPAVDS